MKEFVGEFLGTFILVLFGCGSVASSVLFGEYNSIFQIGIVWGIGVMLAIYLTRHLSCAHLNPAVSVGLWVGGRFDKKELLPYIAAQVLGGIAGAGILYLIASGKPGFELGGFAANGYGEHSPGGYSMLAALVSEVVMTFMFLIVILGATHSKAPKGFAGIAIGLALTLIHLISIPVTNTSVNPARSTSQAIFVGDWALGQLWLFWLAPIVGAILAGLVYKLISPEKE